MVAEVSVAIAQGGPRQDRPRWGRDRIESVIIGKFVSELELTPGQSEIFFPKLREFQRQTEELQREQGERVRTLEGYAHSPSAQPREVNKLLAEKSTREQQISALKAQFLSDLSTTLSPQQVSRCAILLDELPRRVQQFIEEQRRGPPHGQGPRYLPPTGHDVQPPAPETPPAEKQNDSKSGQKDAKKNR